MVDLINLYLIQQKKKVLFNGGVKKGSKKTLIQEGFFYYLEKKLTFRELESLTCFSTTIFFPLYNATISR
jgi:hypothetical protein